MINPLDNVPLNTKRQFVMATTASGCEVYVPVDSFGPVTHLQTALQAQLHREYGSLPKNTPPLIYLPDTRL